MNVSAPPSPTNGSGVSPGGSSMPTGPRGYLEADATVKHSPVGDNGRTTTITVVPGPQIRLRSIVTRNRRLTRRQVVVRNVDLELGTPVRAVPAPEAAERRDAPRTLEEVRSDLYDLGVFRTVTLELIGDGVARDLVVSVNERPRTSIELGGGASTDQGVRSFLRYTQRNVLGLAHQFQLIGQIGLDYRSENISDWILDVTNPEWRAAASYTAPRFPGPRQQLTVDVTLRERRQERTLRIDRSGIGASLRAGFGRRSRTVLTTGVRLEARQLNQFDEAALLSTEAWSNLDNLDRARWQEGISALLLHDLRNDPIRPTRGALFSLNTEWAPGLPWSNQPRTAFVKSEARVSALIPLGAFTLRVAGGAGRIWPLESGTTAPVEDRYRLGGTGSLRGFARDGVGPQNIATRTPADWPAGIGPVIDYSTRDDPDRWVPTGGDTVADGTLEFIAPLPALGATSWEGYALALFADVGNVWQRSSTTPGDEGAIQPTSNQAQFQDVVPVVRVGVGAGLRVETPVGPLQLDVAANPEAIIARDDPNNALDRFDLLRTAWEEPRWRLHLTLGNLF